MKLQSRHRKMLLAAAIALLLICLILPVRIPWLKLLITLGVAWAAWEWADPGKESSFHFPHGVHEQREENGVRICRYVFSSAVLDLTDSSSLPDRIDIQAAFASVSVRLPVDASVAIHSSGAFCSISAPGQKSTVLGENAWQCGTQDPNAPRVFIDASCAFGALSFSVG